VNAFENGGPPVESYVAWEFVAVPWTYEPDVPYTLADGWEPVGAVMIEDEPHLLMRRRRRVQPPVGDLVPFERPEQALPPPD